MIFHGTSHLNRTESQRGQVVHCILILDQDSSYYYVMYDLKRQEKHKSSGYEIKLNANTFPNILYSSLFTQSLQRLYRARIQFCLYGLLYFKFQQSTQVI